LAHTNKQDIGFYISLGANLLDVVTLPIAGPSNPVKIPLSTLISTDMVKIVAKTMGANEQILGSISIPQFIIMNGGIASHTQWITLFEHQDDDEYDGQMGLNDEEEPMILVNFVVSENAVKKDKPKEDRLSAKASPKQPVFTSPKVTKPSGRMSTSVSNRSSLDLKKEPSQTQS
jgi:hypothetical protein